MQFSNWCHILNQDNVSALVNSLTMGVVYVSTDELYNFIETIQFSNNVKNSKFAELLLSEGLLIKSKFDDEKLFAEIHKKVKSEISLELLYLLVSDGCNLRCTYCFEETPLLKGSFKATQMTRITAKKAIDLFAEMALQYGDLKKKKVIHLYGGEPMINREVVYESVFYVNKLKLRGILPKDSQITIITNGTLINEKDVKFFADNDVKVGLSIDGPEYITDFYRIPKRYNVGVTKRIITAFRLLKQYRVSVGLSVTITPLAIEKFDDFLSFFTDGEFSKADGISLNLLHFTPKMNVSDDYYSKAVECQIKAFKCFREIGLYEERVMRKVRAFIDQRPMYADCGVVGNQLVIAPDGRIGVCQDFVKPRKYFPCSVYDNEHKNVLDTLFVNWRNRSPFFMSQCKDCLALGICGGGCPASAELKTGNRFNIDERACYHSKKILEWLVWDAYAQIKKS